jgi:hypothetical protein
MGFHVTVCNAGGSHAIVIAKTMLHTHFRVASS